VTTALSEKIQQNPQIFKTRVCLEFQVSSLGLGFGIFDEVLVSASKF